MQHVIMIEDWELCTYFKHHKQKIVLFLAAMRAYRDELENVGIGVSYESLKAELKDKIKYETKLQLIIDQLGKSSAEKNYSIFEVEDRFFEKRIHAFFEKSKIKLRVLESPMFMCTRREFGEYLKKVKKPFMKSFYEQQRKRLKIMVDDKLKPLGGKWSFDEDNRKKLPADVSPPVVDSYSHDNPHVNDVKRLVEENFSDHPGSLDKFMWPTTRKSARQMMHDFFKMRFAEFGPYEDALTNRSPFVFHSLLSSCINLGLLTPSEVVGEALSQKNISIESKEGFVRQIIGWREFIRGIYHYYGEQQENSNLWKHKNKLLPCWYDATTGIRPIDDVIEKVQVYGFAHHIERLMVVSSAMLLCEVDPKEVNRWFMEMFCDSSDWVMVPNVFGMGQFSDGGIFATKPYVCGSNYLIKMSDTYSKKESWCENLDALYWAFMIKHQDFYRKNPRTSIMAKQVDAMSEEKRMKIISKASEVRKSLVNI